MAATAPPHSVTVQGAYEPFELQVSRGQIMGHQSIFRSAYSTFITSGQNYAIWNRAANYVFPTVASTMTLSSSATGDIGQLINIVGLDANYKEISEVLALNGQTPVTSTKSYFRINGMQVLTDTPTGAIYFGTGTVTSGVPANVYGFISPLDSSMMAGVYTVPAGYTLYIYGGSINGSLSNQNKLITVDFNTVIGGVDYKAAKIITSGGFQYFPYTPPLAIPEKADLIDKATTTDNTPSTLTANLQGILIKNDCQAP